MTANVALAALTVMINVAPNARAQAAPADSSAPRGVSTTVSYDGELVGDVAGGFRRATAFTGMASAQLTLLLHQLVGWRGARLYFYVVDWHGGTPTGIVGDVQKLSNLGVARPAARLDEAWLQQDMLASHLSLLVGRYDQNSEFYRLQSGDLFLNSSLGLGAEFGLSGVEAPSTAPFTAVGARLDIKPSINSVLRLAMLDGVPVDRPNGGIHLFAPGDGKLLMGEMAFRSRGDTTPLPRDRRYRIGLGAGRHYSGKIALGGWYYTARFPDLVDTLSNGAPVQHHGNGGGYVLADQTLWAAGSGRPGLLTGFMQLGIGDHRVYQIAGYTGAGLTFTGLFANRAHDELGLAVAAARNGSHFARAQSAIGIRAAGETAIELTYLAQFGTWLAVQPDLQYIFNPGGTRATRNALAPGLRFALSY